jgi:rRNA-processing protein Efg1
MKKVEDPSEIKPLHFLRNKARSLRRLRTAKAETVDAETCLNWTRSIEALEAEIAARATDPKSAAADAAENAVLVEKKTEKMHENHTLTPEEDELASKYKIMYRAVRFVERKKAVRKINSLQRPNSENQQNSVEALAEAELDLCYIIHYPPQRKYISLYATKCEENEARVCVRNEIAQRIASGEISASETVKRYTRSSLLKPPSLPTPLSAGKQMTIRGTVPPSALKNAKNSNLPSSMRNRKRNKMLQ